MRRPKKKRREVSPLAILAAASTAHACAATAAEHEPPTPPTPTEDDIALAALQLLRDRRDLLEFAKTNEKAVKQEWKRSKVAHDRKQARFEAKMEKLSRARTRTLKGSFATLQMMNTARLDMFEEKYGLLFSELQVAKAERDRWMMAYDVATLFP